MKAVALFLAAIAFAPVAVVGQGQFVFNNQVPPEVNARFITCNDPLDGSASSVGTGYTIQLFNSVGGMLVPLDPPGTTFRGAAGTTVAGYVTPTTETVPGVAPGGIASIVLRLLGPNSAGYSQEYGPYNFILGGDTLPPTNIPLGTTPLVFCVPEPSLVVLALVGTSAALLLGRIRRQTGASPDRH